MLINSTVDYFDAVAKRHHLERILRREARKFSGYGRELFESGICRTLNNLDEAISEYEYRVGYTTWAPYNFWPMLVKEQSFVVSGTILADDFLVTTTSLGENNSHVADLQRPTVQVCNQPPEVPVFDQVALDPCGSLFTPQVVPAGAV
jgi:hypothetical protein